MWGLREQRDDDAPEPATLWHRRPYRSGVVSRSWPVDGAFSRVCPTFARRRILYLVSRASVITLRCWFFSPDFIRLDAIDLSAGLFVRAGNGEAHLASEERGNTSQLQRSARVH